MGAGASAVDANQFATIKQAYETKKGEEGVTDDALFEHMKTVLEGMTPAEVATAATAEGDTAPVDPTPTEGGDIPAADAAPADGDAAPAETEAAPADGEAAPADSEAAPADAPAE